MNTKWVVNKFTDLTHEEFKKGYLGYKASNREKNYANLDHVVPKNDVDWIAAGAVGPV